MYKCVQMSKYMYKKPRHLFIKKLYFGFFQTFKGWKKLRYNFFINKCLAFSIYIYMYIYIYIYIYITVKFLSLIFEKL